ncbi:MAG: hypothetical protein OEY56_10680, partial [Cyclobacteriaceae bacterium]|nr:hypothetical protein [Cyclobacteriaceae bacterium]
MKILYYLVILPLSRLPFRVLYGLSDILYLALYVLAGYRKKVVFSNLRKSFPAKNDDEIREIAGKFYRHFCDLLIESIK